MATVVSVSMAVGVAVGILIGWEWARPQRWFWRRQWVHDGVDASARILAGQGIDCRGLLDIRPDAKDEVEELLTQYRDHERARKALEGKS